MNKLLHLLFCSLLMVTSLFGQSERENDYIPKLNVLNLAAGFLESHATIQFGLEKGITEKMSLYSEAGYSFYIEQSNLPDKKKINGLSGFILETELRNYFGSDVPNFTGQYIALNLQYKNWLVSDNAYFSDTEMVFYGIPGAGFELKDFKVGTDEFAIHLKYGFQKITRSGALFDFSLGVGWLHTSGSVEEADNNVAALYTESYDRPYIIGDQGYISVIAGFRFGWSF